MSSRVTITWTPHKYRQLEKAYAAAIEARRDRFLFEGHTLATAYAKYLLLHLRQKFDDQPLGSGHDIKD